MDPQDYHEEFVEGLWARLRDILLAAQRLEAFAFAPDHPSEPRPAKVAEETADPAARAEMAREFVLRALRAGTDATSYRLLVRLHGPEAVRLSDLAAVAGTGRVALSERINDLVRVGLARGMPETDSVRGTRLTVGLVRLVEILAARLAATIGERAPGLTGGGRT